MIHFFIYHFLMRVPKGVQELLVLKRRRHQLHRWLVMIDYQLALLDVLSIMINLIDSLIYYHGKLINIPKEIR